MGSVGREENQPWTGDGGGGGDEDSTFAWSPGFEHSLNTQGLTSSSESIFLWPSNQFC